MWSSTLLNVQYVLLLLESKRILAVVEWTQVMLWLTLFLITLRKGEEEEEEESIQGIHFKNSAT